MNEMNRRNRGYDPDVKPGCIHLGLLLFFTAISMIVWVWPA